MEMENIRCYEQVVIKEFFQRGNDIIFLTSEGDELRYVGRFGMKELKNNKVRLGEPMLLGVSPAYDICALPSDVAIIQLR